MLRLLVLTPTTGTLPPWRATCSFPRVTRVAILLPIGYARKPPQRLTLRQLHAHTSLFPQCVLCQTSLFPPPALLVALDDAMNNLIATISATIQEMW